MAESNTELLYQELTKIVGDSVYEIHFYFNTKFLKKLY